MSISSSMSIGSSALSAFGAGMQTVTHNVANVNTAGFNPQRAEYSDIAGNNGTRLDAVFQGDGRAGQEGTRVSYDELRQRARDMGASEGTPLESLFPSGTSLEREMVDLVAMPHTYEANAQVVRTADDMLGVILDMKA